MNGTHKDVRAILTRLEKAGYTLRHGGSGAVGLLDKDNEIVRLPLGQPLLIHTTPGSDAAIDGIYNSLKKCGIDLEREEREMEATNTAANRQQVRRNELAAKSHILRERLKKLMLDYEITQADFYHFAEDYCSTHNIEFPKGVQTLVSGFLRGTNLSEKNIPFMERSIKAVEDRQGKIPKGRRMGAKQPKPKLAEDEIEPLTDEEKSALEDAVNDSQYDEDEPRDAEGLPDAGHGDPPPLRTIAQNEDRVKLALRVQSLFYRALLDKNTVSPDEIDKIAQEIIDL